MTSPEGMSQRTQQTTKSLPPIEFRLHHLSSENINFDPITLSGLLTSFVLALDVSHVVKCIRPQTAPLLLKQKH